MPRLTIRIISTTHRTTNSNIIILLNRSYCIATSINSNSIFSQIASSFFNLSSFVIFANPFSIFCTLVFKYGWNTIKFCYIILSTSRIYSTCGFVKFPELIPSYKSLFLGVLVRKYPSNDKEQEQVYQDDRNIPFYKFDKRYQWFHLYMFLDKQLERDLRRYLHIF